MVTPQQTPKMQHKRPMLKSRIQILQGHSKEDLRQKGAAAVFRAACSIRRSTAGRVRHTFIHLYVFVYLSSVIIRPSLSPARDPGLSRHLFKIASKIISDFWSIFGAKNRRKRSQMGRQNPSKIDPKSDWFFYRFLDAILIPKCFSKWYPKP